MSTRRSSEGTSDFLLRASGRCPNGLTSSSNEAAFFARSDAPDRQVDFDEAARVANVSYHLADVSSGEVLESQLTEQISSVGCGCFLPVSFGRWSVLPWPSKQRRPLFFTWIVRRVFSVSAFGEMTLVCCKWSCMGCRAVVTCSSDACFDLGDVVFFVLTMFTDAGDEATSHKEISHVLVRLLLRRDVKTI